MKDINGKMIDVYGFLILLVFIALLFSWGSQLYFASIMPQSDTTQVISEEVVRQ